MYISEVNICGYRSFKDVKIPLNDGINVIIGPNNSGKSNLLQAIALALDVRKRIDVSDIFCETDIEKLKKNPPSISISLKVSQSLNEAEDSEQAGILGSYMINPSSPYSAQLNFEYSLNSTLLDQYKKDVSSLVSAKEIWGVIKKDYARFYETYRWGGVGHKTKDHNLNNFFEKCDFQFLDAIRDVGRDMYMGYNTMLKDVLNFFIDYDIKSDSTKSGDEIEEKLRNIQQKFKEDSRPVIDELMVRLSSGKNVLLDYAKETGACFDNVTPDFSGDLSEHELLSVLRLIIRYETGIEIPATHNGLGYNNLIYMSLLLAKMQVSADGKYMQRKAKIYSMLAIEEPEAHLHPSMQYQLLKFLEKNRENHRVNQILVTTHSTQIVSAVNISNLICISPVSYGVQSIGLPSKVFSDSLDDKNSEAYVQRFLDATRSDMFFANKLILVEGVAEELLIPTFAKYLGYDLAKYHILVVNVGGRYFHHFLKMFNSQHFCGINKKVVCITDIDPCKDGKSCYPFEYGIDNSSSYSRNGDDEVSLYASHPNIRFFRQDVSYGKTLEYDIAWCNSKCKEIILNGMKNESELKDLMSYTSLNEMIVRLRSSEENKRLIASINANTVWSDDFKMKGIIASRYLNSIGKGDNALKLSMVLEDNFSKSDSDLSKFDFTVPSYIINALTWLFQ